MTYERLHPFTLLFRAIDIARSFLFPALIGGFSAGGTSAPDVLVWAVGLLAIPAVLGAIGTYAVFRYALSDDELVVVSGVIRRQRRVIPLARVQNIASRQSALERLCGVVELRVETAGAASTEAVLSVLGREKARRFRQDLLARRRLARAGAPGRDAAAGAAPGLGVEEAPPGAEDLEAERAGAAVGLAEGAERAEVLARLSVRDLAVAGATANEAGLIAAGIAGLLQFIETPEMIPVGWIETLFERLDAAGAAVAGGAVVLLVLGAVVALLLAGWLVSVVGAVVGYHGYTLERSGGELRKRYGLLGRRESTIPLERIQAVRLEESWLRRQFGLATLKLDVAGSRPGERRGAEVLLPIARVGDAADLIASVLPGLDYSGLRFSPVHPRSRRRALVRYGVLLSAIPVGLLAWVADPAVLLLLLVTTPLSWLGARWYYRNLGYAVAADHVIARAGVLTRTTWLVPFVKIQALRITETPFQRRHALATLVMDTAGGRSGAEARVIDLARSRASELLEELAGRVRMATYHPADLAVARGGNGGGEAESPDGAAGRSDPASAD